MKKPIYSFLLSALMAGAGLSAQAQTGVGAKPITLNVSQVSVQDALRNLFAEAGVRNFVIAPDVRGTVNLSLDSVPFSVALKQVLGAVDPPLAADVEDGTYHIRLRSAEPPLDTPAAPDDTGQNSFYKIGIKHYDAGMMADFLTRRGGIIRVPPNFVVPANSLVPGTLASPTAATGGRAAGPPGTPAANAPQNGLLASANVLPPGVKRIFVLESDNSLVVEATAQGYENLTGDRLFSGGYTQVY